MEREAKEALLIRLFRSFPGADKSVSRQMFDAYLAALEKLSPAAVKSAVDEFCEGRVERSSHAFAPSAAELSKQAIKWQGVLDRINGPKQIMHTGIVSVDFGRGSIDMRGLTQDQQDEVFRTKRALPLSIPNQNTSNHQIQIKRIE